MNTLTETGPGVIPERIVLFGSEGGFSRPVLKCLLAAGAPVSAVVIPGYNARQDIGETFPVRVQQPRISATLAGLATTSEIPLLPNRNMQDQRLACDISRLAADILLVACFPFRIPASLRQLARIACWNLHPALLPRYRGPAPVYWQIRNRERNSGVTLHEVSDRLDAGNVVAQQSFPLSKGASTGSLEELIAETGADLFLGALNLWREGHRKTYPQNEALASYYPRPPAQHARHSAGLRDTVVSTGRC